MKKHLHYLRKICTLLLLPAVLFTSCRDDSEIVTVVDLLVAHPWVGVAYTYSVGDDITVKEIKVAPCILDNIFTFSSDGTLTYDEGDLKCFQSAPQTATDEWRFGADLSELIIVVNGQPQMSKIVHLTESSFKTTTVRLVDGVETTYTSTFIAVE